MANRQTRGTNPTRMRFGLAAILFFTLLVSYIDRVNVSVLIADQQFLQDMEIAGQQTKMGLLMSVFLFAYGFTNFLAGPVGAWLGPRKAMTLSIALWGVAVSLGGLAGSLGMMITARILLGIGEGLHWPMQSTFVKNWFPPNERARANSAWLLAIMVGPMIAMPIVSAIVSSYGWRSSFGFLVGCSLLPLGLVWFFTSDHPEQSRFVNSAELNYIAAGLRAEQIRQGKNANEFGEKSLSYRRDKRFWLVTLGFLASASLFWGTMAWLPSYLKVVRNFSWAEMGALASLPYALGAMSVVSFGIVADRSSRKEIFPTVALFGAATCIYLGAIASDNVASVYFLAGSISFIGMGLASYWTIMQNIVRNDAVGAAAGTMNGIASFGSAFIPVFLGYLIEHTGGYTVGLMLLVIMGFLGSVSMAMLLFIKE